MLQRTTAFKYLEVGNYAFNIHEPAVIGCQTLMV